MYTRANRCWCVRKNRSFSGRALILLSARKPGDLSAPARFPTLGSGDALSFRERLGLDLDRGQTFFFHPKLDCRGTREIDDASPYIRPAIVDLDCDRSAILDIGDCHLGS